MHICFVTSEFPKVGFPHGGVGTFIATLSKALIQNGVKVSVVGLNYINKEETEIINGVKVYRVTSKKIKGLKWYFNSKAVFQKIREVHQKDPIDFIETAELGLAFLPKLKGIKYVIRMHGGHHFFAKAENRSTEWWKVFQEKRSFRKADHILAVSNYVAETTRDLLNLGERNIEVIYNPIDVSKFYACDVTKIQKHSIFFAGSIIEKKGIRQLIQSLNYLVDEFPDIHLYIAGRDAKLPGTNIPYRPILEKEINEKIKPHITFLGVIPHDELPLYIEKAEVCCYPSHMETFGLSWVEVLSMGKILIGGNMGPGPEIVEDGETGLLANPHSPEDIATKIKWVFDHPDQVSTIEGQARKIALKKYNVEFLVQQNLDFYSRHL